MRRGSFIFPLVLIALGVLFLASNLYPQIRILDLLGRWWPLLLVAWGAVRSIELGITYSQGRPLPAAGLTGGEWFLAVFLALVGSGIGGFNRFARNFPADRITVRGLEVFGESFDYSTSAKVAGPGINRVVVDNRRGNARIVSGDVSEVTVSGHNSIRSFSESEAAKINKDLGLTVENQAGQVIVRTNQERAPGDVRISSDLEITVPRDVSVECRGRYGDFDVTGITGNIDIDSDNAGVRLQEIGGNVRIDLRRSDIVRAAKVKGSVDVKGRGDDLEMEDVSGPVTVLASYSGDLIFRNIAASVRYESSSSKITFARIPGFARLSRGELMASRVRGPARVESKTKDVRLSEFSGPLEVDVDLGDIELRPGKSLDRMDVRTANGEVELAVPEGVKFTLDAATDRGEAHNEWGAPFQQDNDGRGAKIKGTTGPGPTISLRSRRGGLTLLRSSGSAPDWESSDAPPAPRAPEAPRVSPPSPPTQQ